jgi:hypothetical protein
MHHCRMIEPLEPLRLPEQFHQTRLGIAKGPALARAAEIEVDAVVVQKIRRGLRHAVARDVIRRSDHHLAALPQPARHQRRIAHRSVPDGNVDPVADHVHHVVGEGHVQLDIRKGLEELSRQRQDIALAETDRCIDRERPARQHPPTAGDDLFGIGDFRQDAARPGQIGFTFRRQLQGAGGADDQSRAQPILQSRHQLADR